MFILQRLPRKNQSESVLESPDMDSQPQVEVQLYLASNSPRRKELLSLVGLEYALLPTQVDETPLPGEDGAEYVKRTAQSKAAAARAHLQGAGIIIAADTAVVDSDHTNIAKILGKPLDKNEAVQMLHSLRGHTHQVLTALSILNAQSGRSLIDMCRTDVPMRDFSDAEIEGYVASGDPLDKAGAYAIQHVGFHPVHKLQGCYANVMGLPLCHLTRCLHQMGIPPTRNVPQACQAYLEYDCPVYHSILQVKFPELALS